MDYNILVFYSLDAGYFSARREIEKLVVGLGDKKVVVDKLMDGNIIGVKTVLEPKVIVDALREKVFNNPSEFSSALKWVPVEEWCGAELKSIEQCVVGLKHQIISGERWGVEVETWQRSPSLDDVVFVLKRVIPERFVDEHASKIVFVTFVGRECAVSILKPDEVFRVVPV